MIKAVALLLVLGTVCVELNGVPLDLPVIDSRIINGQDAIEGEFPYMITMRMTDKDEHACGGTVITKDWVLTSAHCCVETTTTNRKIGAGSIYQYYGLSLHAIDKIIVHKDYQPTKSWINDICVIRVKQPFKLGDKIKAVTLPTQDMPVASGEKCVVPGWGWTKAADHTSSPNGLKKAVGYRAMNNDDCGVEAGVPMFPGFLCARNVYKKQGVNYRDCGGPLIANNVQVGVVSWSLFPYAVGNPDFFTRVPKYINWIKEQLGSEAKDLKFVS